MLINFLVKPDNGTNNGTAAAASDTCKRAAEDQIYLFFVEAHARRPPATRAS